MKIKLLALFIALVTTIQISIAAPFSANAKTKRIPAGTKLTMQLLSPVTTSANLEGTDFTAMLLTDQTADNDVILPMGTVVRGNIKRITPAQRMSKGAILYMDFDHIVTPNGRQLPLSLNIVGRTDLTYDGGITTTKGYADAFRITCKKSADITRKSVDWGKEVGGNYWNGNMKYLSVPVGAIGGALGTAGFFVYDSIADMIRKGENVYLEKGEELQVILIDPIDVPVI
ncbi:MAG: hypothetical protein E7Z93_06960 [Cyanobacteria bacterium SIG32]|nr:hypothetical protein [Cyanobacteria bacterium SIG32]